MTNDNINFTSGIRITGDGEQIYNNITANWEPKEKPMYKVKTSLLSDYQQGETITDR